MNTRIYSDHSMTLENYIVTAMESYLLVCGGREEEGLCRVGLEMASAVGRRLQVATLPQIY